MSNKILVAISIYKNDRVEFVSKAIDSIIHQEYNLDNIFILIKVDGLVSNDIMSILDDYAKLDNILIQYHSTNRGLAHRLNQIIDFGLDKGCFSYLARMDADDISTPERFINQVLFLESHPNIDVVGSDVIEIDSNDKPIFYKKMYSTHEMLLRNIIKRCPFNHPSVMFRMSLFNEGFRYNSSLMNTQDYYLWIDLLAGNKKFANINKPLLLFRINANFHSRRGLSKALNDVNSRLYAFSKLKNLNLTNIIHVFSLFLLRLSPSFVKKIAYRMFR